MFSSGGTHYVVCRVHRSCLTIVDLLILILVGFSALCTSLVFVVGYVCFTSNILQFGVDQLHDSPAKDQSVFIHWFVWTGYTSSFIYHILILTIFPVGATINEIPVVVSLVFILFVVTIQCKQKWFLIEPGRINPYRLVYKVTGFARRHKLPVNRSAFTYCEDEWPSRLDLGKTKYGGPFLTEEVEDVKAFYGILQVLFALGPVFSLSVAADTNSPLFHPHTIISYAFTTRRVFSAILHANFLLSPFLILVSIPFYLCILQPYAVRYIPRMLSRMGIGMFLSMLIILSKLMLSIITSFNELKTKDNDIMCGHLL